MNLNIRKHLLYYIPLSIILLVGIMLAVQASYDLQLQTMVVLSLGLFYVAWGVLHHFVHHSLSSKIVIEYALIGALGIAIVLFVLKGIV